MNRLFTGAAVVSLALASTAVAKPNPHTFRAVLQPVGATSSGPTGRADLNDGKKKDEISIHMRGLQGGTTYTWHLHRQIVCIAAPCDPPQEPGWIYEPLTAKKHGNAEAKGASFTFAAQPGATYVVDVHAPNGDVVAQGTFTAKH
jgi:hypothetical protein